MTMVEHCDMERLHKSVMLDGIEIDEKIAPLIKALWDNGFDTYMSCQGGPVYTDESTDPVLTDYYRRFEPDTWIIFANYVDAETFVRQTLLQTTRRVLGYYRLTPEDRGERGLWVLNQIDLALKPLDPYETNTIRGKVTFSTTALQDITKLWSGESDDSCEPVRCPDGQAK